MISHFVIECYPPNGQPSWDGPSMADYLGVSKDAVWRLLRPGGVWLSRQRTWSVSTDPEFIPKTADTVGLRLKPTPKCGCTVSE